MDLIILPGNSINNKRSSEEMLKILSPLFNRSFVHEYKHWQAQKGSMNLEEEIQRLKNSIDAKKEYIIVAKSIGSVLAMKFIAEENIRVKGCVFLGVPVNWCKNKDMDIDKVIRGFSTKLRIFQNTQDPTTSSEDLKEYLEDMQVRNYSLTEVEASDHEYEDFELIKKAVQDLIK